MPAAPEPFEIRRLEPFDAPVYRAMMLEAYARHPDAFTASVAERSPLPLSWWEKRLGACPAGNQLVFGAYAGGTLQGVAGLELETREKMRHKAKLFGMYVCEPARGRGAGRQLVQAVLHHARRLPGMQVVQLTVMEANVPAQRLYQSCGFDSFGVEPMAVAEAGGFYAKVHMWCRLHAENGETSS